MKTASKEELLEILTSVKDPELPFIDIVELGIVRDVESHGDHVTVSITPTYSGCPAMHVIEKDVGAVLRDHGFENVEVRTVYSPAWSTEWMSEETRQKFRENGIAPPQGIAPLRRAKPTIPCPFCGSANTIEKSEFGSTACKSIHFCKSCDQPFDYFKAF